MWLWMCTRSNMQVCFHCDWNISVCCRSVFWSKPTGSVWARSVTVTVALQTVSSQSAWVWLVTVWRRSGIRCLRTKYPYTCQSADCWQVKTNTHTHTHTHHVFIDVFCLLIMAKHRIFVATLITINSLTCDLDCSDLVSCHDVMNS